MRGFSFAFCPRDPRRQRAGGPCQRSRLRLPGGPGRGLPRRSGRLSPYSPAARRRAPYKGLRFIWISHYNGLGRQLFIRGGTLTNWAVQQRTVPLTPGRAGAESRILPPAPGPKGAPVAAEGRVSTCVAGPWQPRCPLWAPGVPPPGQSGREFRSLSRRTFPPRFREGHQN